MDAPAFYAELSLARGPLVSTEEQVPDSLSGQGELHLHLQQPLLVLCLSDIRLGSKFYLPNAFLSFSS